MAILEPFIVYEQIKRPVDWSAQFRREGPVDVEIGFGNGEYLVKLAQENPDRNYVGLEQHWERIYKTLKKIQTNKLDNVRVALVDARIAFERLFLPKTIENILCLFPCPWPKKRHEENRLFSNDFLRLINSRLVSKGAVKIVTDFFPYRDWIIQEQEGSGFEVKIQTISPTYNTKFEKKWKDAGQDDFYELRMQKQQNVDCPFKEDEELKKYTIIDFDPEKFMFRDVKGDVTVIFKDYLYDPQKKKGMIHLVVVEEDITQHLWVAVVFRGGKWEIHPSEGNRFVPTKGVAKALEHVYRSCLETTGSRARK